MQACKKFLFGVRKILIGWWGSGAKVRVEVSGRTEFLKVAGKVVVTVSALDGRLQCDWDEERKGWEDFNINEKVTELVERVVTMLKGGGKGQGKGKNKNAPAGAPVGAPTTAPATAPTTVSVASVASA